MRLTNPLNLPAPGRSQTLYVGLSPSQSPVFLVNSRDRLFSATLLGFVCTTTPTEGTPSSEVTVSICLVPWRRVLSGALGFSPHPPVSVYGTDTLQTPRGIFLGSVVSLNPHRPWPQGPIAFQPYPVFYPRAAYELGRRFNTSLY